MSADVFRIEVGAILDINYMYILYRLHSCQILCHFQSSDILLEIEFMRCELMVQSLGEKKENYSKAVVEVRSHKRHFL